MADMKKDIKELQEKIEELTAGWQRTQADFVNYKRQAAEDRARTIKQANADLIAELLPVLDNFQLAAKHLPENLKDDSWAQGVQQIEKQFENILLDSGLEKIESLGQQFNPEYHEAVEEIESDHEAGTIIEELSSGYKFDGIVLRPSRVKVAK